ncbi:hypothetical protein [Amycolatopsis sacchari]|uniref:hypothetical protein n=1 Tax=Amycolatopsis sacchari TaxID=115433 RepID=UPI003D743F84
MPTNTVNRKTRFANNATGKNKVSRKTRFGQKPTGKTNAGDLDAAIAASLDDAVRRAQRANSKTRKSGRRWASDQHVTAASKINGQGGGQAQPGAPDAPPVPVGSYEQERRWMIRDRNRRRRYPWLPGLGAIVWGLLASLVAKLFTWTTSVPAEAVVGVMAGLVVVLALAVVLHHRQPRWVPELAAAGLGAAAVTYWIGMAGMSWQVVLVVLVGTIVGGTRWWKAHPIGPGVPRLEPYRPEPEPEPEPEPQEAPSSVPPPETDPYCIAWNENNARGEGKAKGSRLTNRRDDEFTVTYDVELKRGVQSLKHLLANREELAGGLGEDTERVLFKRAPRGAGANRAVLTIITKDPVAETRFYTGPRVEDGVIKGVARFIDGSGEIDITMWDDGGTVGTMVVGSTGGGKSGAANVLTCGAMSTGVMNLLYADPKGNSSTALAERARVAIIGKENVLKLPYLVTAMLKARAELAAQLGADQIFPSAEIPGWMFLHDEYSLIANDPLAQKVWTETVNIVRAYGIWAVALNQSQGQPQWGNDHARSAFASQVIAFRVNSKSGSDLVPGLNFDPNELPVDEKGRPVPGMAVHAHYDTPTRWDFLPSEANAARMAEKGEPAPPYTTTTAFDTFFNQPEPHWMDVLAIQAVLGPAKNGRWQVGGRGATHQFPESLTNLPQAAGQSSAQPKKGRWGQRGAAKSSPTGQLTPAQAEVLAIVRGGTTNTGEIIDAAKASKSSVHDALDTLTTLGLICKTGRGVYEPVATDA